MKEPNPPLPRAIRFYSLLLKFYPAPYRQAFTQQMLQTFKDHYNDMDEEERHMSVVFWFGVLSDELKGIAREQAIALWRREWLFFGIILGILIIPLGAQVGLTFYVNLPSDLADVLTLVSTFGPLLVIMLASFVTARKSGSILQGTITGLLAVLVGAAITIGTVAALMLLFWNIAVANALRDPGMLLDFRRSAAPTFADFVLDDSLRGAAILTTLAVVAGVVLGAAGGFLGRVWPRAMWQKSG